MSGAAFPRAAAVGDLIILCADLTTAIGEFLRAGTVLRVCSVGTENLRAADGIGACCPLIPCGRIDGVRLWDGSWTGGARPHYGPGAPALADFLLASSSPAMREWARERLWCSPFAPTPAASPL